MVRRFAEESLRSATILHTHGNVPSQHSQVNFSETSLQTSSFEVADIHEHGDQPGKSVPGCQQTLATLLHIAFGKFQRLALSPLWQLGKQIVHRPRNE